MAAVNNRTFVSLNYSDVKNLRVFIEQRGSLWWANIIKHTASTFSHDKQAFLEESDAQSHIDDEVSRFQQYNGKSKEVL